MPAGRVSVVYQVGRRGRSAPGVVCRSRGAFFEGSEGSLADLVAGLEEMTGTCRSLTNSFDTVPTGRQAVRMTYGIESHFTR